MKKELLLAAVAGATLLSACQNTTQRVDRFDNVRIQQMEANNVSRNWFEKVVVCLNARREVRADGTTDHFLLLEHTPIPDFTLAPGQSFTLLVDGTRHTFAPTNSPAAIVSRPGFATLTFRTEPQVFVEIANARNVELRLKGTSNVLEKRLARASISEFKSYLLKYYQAPPAPPNQPVTKSAKRD
ncbi:MAG: hypothetical protein RLZZ265_3992 [Verrucomicrobiota bacterium]|jgi:hypothetical protein